MQEAGGIIFMMETIHGDHLVGNWRTCLVQAKNILEGYHVQFRGVGIPWT